MREGTYMVGSKLDGASIRWESTASPSGKYSARINNQNNQLKANEEGKKKR